MKILRTMCNWDLSKKEVYRFTMADTNISVKNIPDNEVLDVSGYCEYNDVDNKGKEQHLLSIKSDKGYITTNSETFIRNFLKIADLFEDEGSFKIVKLSGITKNDKPFVNCSLADD